jgi:hypothetical protein
VDIALLMALSVATGALAAVVAEGAAGLDTYRDEALRALDDTRVRFDDHQANATCAW